MPEYTISLLIWIIPIILISIFIAFRKLLNRPKIIALSITIAVLAVVGFILDLLFAHYFFTFPDTSMVIGWSIRGIPVEEFIFYITGFWFIIFVYIFCDEYFLLKYNPPDKRYARYRAKIKRLIFFHTKSIYLVFVFLIAGIVVKHFLNPEGPFFPGYYTFLTLVAYIPTILFFRITRTFVNWRALIVTSLATLLISVIWEVTLAIPRGYWGYQPKYMLGIFISPWYNLPLEAVSVWLFCALVILVYEFLKIAFFTRID